MKTEQPQWKYNNIYSVIMMLAVLIPLVGGIFYGQGVTQSKIDQLTVDVQKILQNQETNLQAMNRVESHLCTLDTIHNIVCIANQ